MYTTLYTSISNLGNLVEKYRSNPSGSDPSDSYNYKKGSEILMKQNNKLMRELVFKRSEANICVSIHKEMMLTEADTG